MDQLRESLRSIVLGTLERTFASVSVFGRGAVEFLLLTESVPRLMVPMATPYVSGLGEASS